MGLSHEAPIAMPIAEDRRIELGETTSGSMEGQRVSRESWMTSLAPRKPAEAFRLRRAKRVTLCVMMLAGLGGCGERREASVQIRNPYLGPMRIAVAPALNFSGSRDFDPNAVADLMASELSYVDGVEVLPVSRVLAALAREGLTEVDSPAQALAIKERLGADAILVFGVTEYDPYDPPVVGIAAQLYGRRPEDGMAGLDPVLASRSASPVGARPMAAPDAPLAQVQRVYNAAYAPTVAAIREFAEIRGADKSPFGWRKYVVSQQHYLRFCCHATITQLVQNGLCQAPKVDEVDDG